MSAQQQLPRPASQASVQDAAQAVATATTEATGLQTRVILRVIFIALAVAAGMWLLYSLEGVILLIVLSIFFAYLVSPLVEFVRRPFKIRGGERIVPRTLAVGVVYLLLFGSLALVLYLLIPQLGNQIEEFTKQSPTYRSILQGRTQNLGPLAKRIGLPEAAQTAVANNSERIIEEAQNYAGEIGKEAVGMLIYLPWLILIPILAFFLLKDAEGFRRSALQMLPRGRLRWRGDEFFQDVNSTLAAYIRAQLTACLFIGIVCTFGFWLIGVPYWLPLGIIAGVLEFIPLAGPLAVMVVAAISASFATGSKVALVLTFLIVLRLVHDYVIYPRIIGSGIHLHPLAVVLAILCGEELAGLAGIFLAIPAVAVIAVTYRHWMEHKGSEGIVADLLKPAEQAVTAPATGEVGALPPANIALTSDNGTVSPTPAAVPNASTVNAPAG